MSLLNQQSRKLPVPPVDPNYPAWRFHSDGRSLLVRSFEQEPTEDGWGTKQFPKADPPAALTLEEQLIAVKLELAVQKQKFDDAWEGLVAEHEALKAAHDLLVLEAATPAKRANRRASTESPAEAGVGS